MKRTRMWPQMYLQVAIWIEKQWNNISAEFGRNGKFIKFTSECTYQDNTEMMME